jgi:hypothetical protein
VLSIPVIFLQVIHASDINCCRLFLMIYNNYVDFFAVSREIRV